MTELNDRALHAQRLLEDDLLCEAFDAMREAVRVKWEQTSPDNPDRMVRLRIMLQCIDGVWSNLQAELDAGKIQAHEKKRR